MATTVEDQNEIRIWVESMVLHTMATTIEEQNEIRIWVEPIEEKLKNVHSLQSVYYAVFRVPKQLRKLNPEAYTPQLVSIGPLHYKEMHLQSMETQKLQYLKFLMERSSGATLDAYFIAVRKLEEEARECYSETFDFDKQEFVTMMVMDGCFILAVLMKLTSEKDYLLSNTTRHWEIVIDLIKLENQLPFFVLEDLYKLIFPSSTFSTSSHHILVWLLLVAQGLHCLDPDLSNEEVTSLLPEGRPKHLLDLLRCALIPSSPRTRIDDEKQGLIYPISASELKKAGVKFQKKEIKSSDDQSSPETTLFDIDFNKNTGVLTIPTISIFDHTEHILRNFIAFEQGQEDSTDYFSAYAAFMDGLIDTKKDIELLVHNGIVVNRLGSPEDALNLFNNIANHITIRDPYFSGVIKDLGDYHKKAWNKRKAILKQNYFNNPWALISFIAAVFLLVSTLIQVICSILQVLPDK